MFVTPSSHFKLFVVDAVEVAQGEAGRDEKRLPTLSFGQSDHSRNYAMITITSDF